MSLVEKKKYEQCVSVFSLSSLHINVSAEFPFVCKQRRWYVFGPALSCPLSLPLSFLHPIPFHFSHYATQPKLPSTVPVLLLAKDSQKLLGLHTMIQAILLFSHPSSNCCPSFAGDLFAGHGDGLGEQRAHSSSGVHGPCLKSHCYVPFSRESLVCDWAVTAMEHRDI